MAHLSAENSDKISSPWPFTRFQPPSFTAQRMVPITRPTLGRFANNFATDLAPIISLFGEQVTKQFLSEYTTIIGAIIFAFGLLGIITVVASCTRVVNSTLLKPVN